MEQNSDLIELLGALNASGAKFLFVGAYAFAYHGRPRATKDSDIFIGSDPQNARKVWKALVAFGAPLADLREDDLIANKRAVARPQDLADVAYLELEP